MKNTIHYLAQPSSYQTPVRFGLALFTALLCVRSTQAVGAQRGATQLEQNQARRIKALGTNRHFKAALDRLFASARKEAISLHNMDPGMKEIYIQSLKQYLKRVQASGNFNLKPPKIVQSMATYERSLADDLRSSLASLKRDIPEPPQSSAEVGQAATDYTYKNKGHEYGFSNIDENYCERVDCDCLAACNEEYRQAYNQAGYDWFVGALGFNPSKMFFGWAEMTIIVHQLQRDRLDCNETCDGVDYDNRCTDDSDCSSEEYCHRKFGNPFRSCRARKAVGETCSRHAKCSTGCCKYHIGTNPVSKVCRPENKCN